MSAWPTRPKPVTSVAAWAPWASAASEAARFDRMETFGSSYSTPGWQRARNRGGFGSGSEGFGEASTSYGAKSGSARGRGPLTIEGELVAKSTGTVSAFSVGDRVFHQKFGNGNVTHVEGNKLVVMFDHAGEKHVVDRFVERV